MIKYIFRDRFSHADFMGFVSLWAIFYYDLSIWWIFLWIFCVAMIDVVKRKVVDD